MSVLSYALEQHVLMVGGQRITEFAKGDAIKHSFDGDDWSAQQGSHGRVVRSKLFNATSTLVITLLQGSPACTLLEAVGQAADIVPLPIFLVNSATLLPVLEIPQAWLQKDPEITLAEEAGTREWTWRCANAITQHGPLGLIGDLAGLVFGG